MPLNRDYYIFNTPLQRDLRALYSFTKITSFRSNEIPFDRTNDRRVHHGAVVAMVELL